MTLRKGELAIACEIGVTTTPEHEMQNIAKCLSAGFERVLVISPEKRALARVERLASEALREEQRARVDFCSPDKLFELLDAAHAELRPVEQSVRGYRVKVRFRRSSTGGVAGKRGAVAAVIAKALRLARREGYYFASAIGLSHFAPQTLMTAIERVHVM